MVDKESIDNICNRIREDGEKEVGSILDKANRTASEITDKASMEGQKVAEKILKEAEGKGEAARRRLLSSVNLEVKRAKLRAREEIVSEVHERVKEVLVELRKSDDYALVLGRLIAEAMSALDGDRFLVNVDRRDLGLLESKVFPLVREIVGKEGRSVKDISTGPLEGRSLGGARVGIPGGKVVFDNTFEARMYRFRDGIRRIIFEEVFALGESEGSGSA